MHRRGWLILGSQFEPLRQGIGEVGDRPGEPVGDDLGVVAVRVGRRGERLREGQGGFPGAVISAVPQAGEDLPDLFPLAGVQR